jgi:hypothetical protein
MRGRRSFFDNGSELGSLPGLTKIDRLMPIVSETEQIPPRPNFPLKSKARIFDGSGDGSLSRMEKIAVLDQRVLIAQNN